MKIKSQLLLRQTCYGYGWLLVIAGNLLIVKSSYDFKLLFAGEAP